MSEEQIIVQLNPDVPPTGSDLGIVNAARKSFGRRSEWETYYETSYYEEYAKYRLKDKDKRLLEFLARGMTADDFEQFCVDFSGADIEDYSDLLWQWRNTPTHDTPFNHGFFSFEIKAPIFVRAQLVKHEYLIMSEYSRRYITDDIEFYTPTVWRKAAADVKQGSSSESVDIYDIDVSQCNPQKGEEHWGGYFVGGILDTVKEDILVLYRNLLAAGVAPEQARMVLPQSLMTSWTWSGTLGAFAKMCTLRLAPDSQYETRLVAQKVYEELKKQFPVGAPLLVEGVK